MTSRRRLAGLVATLVAGLALAAAVPPAPPAGAVEPGWTLTIDDHPPVVGGRAVRVTGAARSLDVLGLGLVPVTSVTVTLVPRVGLPAACTPTPLTSTVAPRDGRYDATVTPPCNGPYRIEVTARNQLGAGSGSPRVEDVGLADPGPAPPAPGASAVPGGVAVTWATASVGPDVVGWRVVGVRTHDVGPGTGRVVDAAGPGAHEYRLVARRWGADGPAGGEVTSAPSAPASATVAPPAEGAAPAVPPPAATPGPGPGRAGAPPTTAAPPTAPPTTAAPRRGAPTRGSGSNAPLPAGYSEELPYGVPDGAFVPGRGGADDDGSGGEQAAAGSSPRTETVRTTERTTPGLVAPFALALVLLTVAVHVSAHLRRTARAARRPAP